jgi:hypothetical protein
VAFFNGTTRAVLCVGRLAIKFARSRVGARGNQCEADLYQRSGWHRRVLLCPPIYCFPLGVVLVMRRAGAMTEAEYREHVRDAGLMLRWDYLGPGDVSSPFEPKANAWGVARRQAGRCGLRKFGKFG